MTTGRSEISRWRILDVIVNMSTRISCVSGLTGSRDAAADTLGLKSPAGDHETASVGCSNFNLPGHGPEFFRIALRHISFSSE